jgi:hypothetical protein
MLLPKEQNKKYNSTKYRVPEIVVSHKKGSKKTGPYVHIKCGCSCGEGIKIYYYNEEKSNPLGLMDMEINGVFGDIRNWREVLLPLLGLKMSEVADGHYVNCDWYAEEARKDNLPPNEKKMTLGRAKR